MLASSSYPVEQHLETVCITVKVFFVVEKRPDPTTGTPHPGWTAHPLIIVCIDRRSWTIYRLRIVHCTHILKAHQCCAVYCTTLMSLEKFPQWKKWKALLEKVWPWSNVCERSVKCMYHSQVEYNASSWIHIDVIQNSTSTESRFRESKALFFNGFIISLCS